MADGFFVPLAPEQIAQLEAGAERYGLSPEDYAAALIEAGLTGAPARIINRDPAIDHAIVEEAIRTGDTIPWPEFRTRLRHSGPTRLHHPDLAQPRRPATSLNPE